MLFSVTFYACLSLINIKVRIRDAEEGMRGRDPHEGNVVVIQDILRVDVSLVSPDKVVQLVVEYDAVSAPAHQAHDLGRMLVLLRLFSLLLAAILNGVAEENVQEEVYEGEDSSKRAHDPVKDAHVDFHELPLDEARIGVHFVFQEDEQNLN